MSHAEGRAIRPPRRAAAGGFGGPGSAGRAHELGLLLRSLKAHRAARGLSLTDVAASSGLTRAAISRLENGRNLNPTLDTLYRYAAALGRHVTLEAAAPAAGAVAPGGRGAR